MRIAVCTLQGSPDDVSVWSGTPAHFLEGLRAIHGDVVTIGPLAPVAYKVLNKVAGLTGKFGRKVNWEVEPAALRIFTREFDRRVAALNPDVVVVMGWVPFKPTTTTPILFWGDATIGQRLGKAQHWSGLAQRTLANAERVERDTLARLNCVIMPSRWAADDVIHRYGIPAMVAPFGSNIADPGVYRRTPPAAGAVRLLSVGVKWERKGMDTAVETADALKAAGVDVHLDIVGVNPPDQSWLRDNVTFHGFIPKNARGTAKLDALYRGADVFLMPTRNDPFPMVLAEAAAHGLPIVASDVGGVPDRVRNGVTGTILKAESTPDEYATAVWAIASDETQWKSMGAAARDHFEDAFTWTQCAQRIVQIAERCLADEASSSAASPI